MNSDKSDDDTLEVAQKAKPGIAQKYVEAGWLGRKAGRGFYPYGTESAG